MTTRDKRKRKRKRPNTDPDWSARCIVCAEANDVAPETAQLCEDGVLGCEGCPFTFETKRTLREEEAAPATEGALQYPYAARYRGPPLSLDLSSGSKPPPATEGALDEPPEVAALWIGDLAADFARARRELAATRKRAEEAEAERDKLRTLIDGDVLGYKNAHKINRAQIDGWREVAAKIADALGHKIAGYKLWLPQVEGASLPEQVDDLRAKYDDACESERVLREQRGDLYLERGHALEALRTIARGVVCDEHKKAVEGLSGDACGDLAARALELLEPGRNHGRCVCDGAGSCGWCVWCDEQTAPPPGCCVGKSCEPDTCMRLPDGNTCNDCAHAGRCRVLIGRKGTERSCDWFPRRFWPTA